MLFNWKRLDVKADKVKFCGDPSYNITLVWWRNNNFQIFISPDGKLVWMISNKIAYGLVEPLEDCPLGAEWIQAASNISHASFRDRDAWYITTNGEVSLVI